MRILLYTGKGGVGKTTVAATTALRSAQLGHKTIVFSTDPAHSLSDSFDLPLGSDPKLVMDNLWGQEMEIGRVLENHWGTIQHWLSALMAWRGVDEMVADEIAVLPGMEELASLLFIADYYDHRSYDVIIVDCAPTGETLRLLSFPEILRWWMEKLFPIERRAASIIRPLARPFLHNLPIPDDEVFASIEHLFERLNRMHSIITNAAESSVRLVLNPEKMVIKEAQRSHTYLSLYGYFTDLVICNRVIPESVTDSYFQGWKDAQRHYLQLIEEAFAPLPIIKAPLMEQEVVGLPQLAALSDTLFGQEDPTRFYCEGQTQSLAKHAGYYELSLTLPFATKEAIELSKNGDELTIQVGSYRRNIILPRAMARLEDPEAHFEGNILKVAFPDRAKGGRPRRR